MKATGRAPGVHERWYVLVVACVLLDCTGILAMGVVAADASAILRSVGAGRSFPGLMATAFFLAGSLTALSVGPHIDRLGVRRTAVTAGSVTAGLALPLLAMGGTAPWLIGSAIAGACFSVTLPATNAILRSVLRPRHVIVGVCVKQAAIPLSVLLAGSAVSLLGTGPRATFFAADVMAALVIALFVLVNRPDTAAGKSPPDFPRRIGGPVLRYGVATLLASLTAGALIGYSSISLQASGMSARLVAQILVLGNLGGIATRVLSGVVTQRLRMTSWWPVTFMMVSGALGVLALCSRTPLVAGVGALIAFALGWGWSGLTFALVLTASGRRPASSGAALQAGGMLGTAAGPLVMVAADQSVGLTAGWVLMAIALAAAGWLVKPGSYRAGLHRG